MRRFFDACQEVVGCIHPKIGDTSSYQIHLLFALVWIEKEGFCF